MEPVVYTEEDMKREYGRGYVAGLKKGLLEALMILLKMPYEAQDHKTLERLIRDYIKVSKGWIGTCLYAVPGEYTNKKGITSKAWFSQNGKYLSKRKDDETSKVYSGNVKLPLDEDIEVVITEERYTISQRFYNIGAFINHKYIHIPFKKTDVDETPLAIEDGSVEDEQPLMIEDGSVEDEEEKKPKKVVKRVLKRKITRKA
jgi:hypothetical protein